MILVYTVIGQINPGHVMQFENITIQFTVCGVDSSF